MSWADYEEELIKLTDSLLDQHSPPQEAYHCPKCGGLFHVQLSIYGKQGRKKLGLMAWCENCGPALARDFNAVRVPRWLREDSQPFII
jgi:hypothetical protein